MKELTPLTRNEIKEATIQEYSFFKELCNQLNLRHWVAFGTLLGAVRHKGFIPWDDDFDVFMPRKDLEALILYYQTNKDAFKNYNILFFETNRYFPYSIARFNDTNFIVNEPNCRYEYGLGVFIDIYPLDGIDPKDINVINKLKKKRNVYDLFIPKKIKKSNNVFKNIVKSFLRILTPKSFISTLNKSVTNISKKYNFDESLFCGDICWDPRFCFEREWFKETIVLPFEGICVNAPSGYHNLLKYIYGDYMTPPPIDKRVPYHIEEAFLKQ